MTKEQAIERMDIAFQIYQLMCKFPLQERNSLLIYVDQFNQADWQAHYEKEKGHYGVAMNNSIAMPRDPVPSY